MCVVCVKKSPSSSSSCLASVRVVFVVCLCVTILVRVCTIYNDNRVVLRRRQLLAHVAYDHWKVFNEELPQRGFDGLLQVVLHRTKLIKTGGDHDPLEGIALEVRSNAWHCLVLAHAHKDLATEFNLCAVWPQRMCKHKADNV